MPDSLPLKTRFRSLTSSLPHLSRHLPPAPQSNPPQRDASFSPYSSPNMADRFFTRNEIIYGSSTYRAFPSQSNNSSLPPRKTQPDSTVLQQKKSCHQTFAIVSVPRSPWSESHHQQLSAVYDCSSTASQKISQETHLRDTILCVFCDASCSTWHGSTKSASHQNDSHGVLT